MSIDKDLKNTKSKDNNRNIIVNAFNAFGKAIIPERFSPHLRNFFLKAGYSEVPYVLFSMLFLISILLTLILLFFHGIPLIKNIIFGPNLLRSTNIASILLFGFFIVLYWLVVQGLIVLTFFIMSYVYYDLKIFNRTKSMENSLTDFLASMSENLKGGLSVEKSIWLSIRPDMGELAKEIRLTAKKVMVGEPTEEALMNLANKYNSPEMKRAFSLINEGIESGSNIAFIVDKLVENMDKTKNLRDEMISTNTSYMMFIGLIVLIIMPILFSISYQLINIMSSFSNNPEMKASMANQASSGSFSIIHFKGISLSTGDYVTFSYALLAISSVFAGMLMSIIMNGNIKSGLKYIILFVIISAIVFTLALAGSSAMFGVFTTSAA